MDLVSDNKVKTYKFNPKFGSSFIDHTYYFNYYGLNYVEVPMAIFNTLHCENQNQCYTIVFTSYNSIIKVKFESKNIRDKEVKRIMNA